VPTVPSGETPEAVAANPEDPKKPEEPKKRIINLKMAS